MIYKRIKCASHALGDTLACIAAVEHYCKTFKTEVDLEVTSWLRPYLQPCYPQIRLTDVEQPEIVLHYFFEMPVQAGFAFQLYQPFCSMGDFNWDFVNPKIRPIEEYQSEFVNYWAFSIHSTSQIKYWNTGNREDQVRSPKWRKLIDLLKKDCNINAVWVDKDYGFGSSPYFNELNYHPRVIGQPFDKVLNTIAHSNFFIGLSSGLSWVARGLGKKSVMIAPWASPKNEFGPTDDLHIRVDGKSECVDCWSKDGINFDKGKWYWCPKHEGTPREFECSASIDPNDIKKLLIEKGWV